MLSSKFVVISFLYLVYGSGFVAAVPRGGGQVCESVRTVTVVHTVTPNQPPPSSSPPNNVSPPPSSVTQQPNNVNLGNGNGNNKNGNTNQSGVNNKNGNTKNGNTKSSSTSVAPPTATPPGKSNVVNSGNGSPDTSLTLDPSVIQNVNGTGQGAGQSDSLVSTNNFINFCAGKTITNGLQVKTGSCNPTPMGDLPSVDNMPTSKFQSPTNFGTIPANTQFDIALKVNNLNTGTFVNAASAYFAAPQQLVNGVIKGHSHISVQQMQSLDSTQPLDPKVFAFFKGVNTVADSNGVLTVTVTNGLPSGVYRISSINAAANHQEVTGPIAQHGSFNDAIYVTVTDNGQNPNANAVPSSSIASGGPTSSTVLPTSVSSDGLSSSISSPTVSSTSPTVSPSNGGGGLDSKTPTSDSLPVSTSSGLPDVSSTSPTVSPSNSGGGLDSNSPPADSLPVSTSSGSLDVSSTASQPSPTGNGGQNDALPSESLVPSSAGGNSNGDPTTSLPGTPTPTSGDNGYNGPNYKRMHRRSPFA